MQRVRLAAWLWRWWERFRDGRGTLSAKGIAFYSFFGVLSGLAIAFSVAALVPEYEQLLLEILDEALPGLVGPEGIDPDQLAALGSTVGIIGVAVLLYSAISIVRAVDDGVRLIYGVQYEPRNFAIKTLRFFGYLLILVPLVGLSYVGSSVTAGLFQPLLDTLGITGTVARVTITTIGVMTSLLLNSVVIMITISRLGGVRPARWRWRSSMAGGVALEVVKVTATYFVALTLSNPRYLSFGAPVAMLLLFFAMSVILLVTAALVATANEPDPVTAARRQQRPLEAAVSESASDDAPDPAGSAGEPGAAVSG